MELFLIVAIVAIFTLPILFRLVFFRVSGESAVNSQLQVLTEINPDYRLFNDLILKTPDGTTQIDHVVLSVYGVFVIETKDLSGWIFGDAQQKRWTQSLYGNKYQFQNPLYQNYKHVKAVQSFLRLESKCLFSAVVFTGSSRFMTEMPDNVLVLPDLIPFIQSRQEKIIPQAQFEKACQLLSEYVMKGSITHEDHMRNIEQNRIHPICPKCGIRMVLREARNGLRKGSQFWGCSNYPSCRSTKRKYN